MGVALEEILNRLVQLPGKDRTVAIYAAAPQICERVGTERDAQIVLKFIAKKLKGELAIPAFEVLDSTMKCSARPEILACLIYSQEWLKRLEKHARRSKGGELTQLIMESLLDWAALDESYPVSPASVRLVELYMILSQSYSLLQDIERGYELGESDTTIHANCVVGNNYNYSWGDEGDEIHQVLERSEIEEAISLSEMEQERYSATQKSSSRLSDATLEAVLELSRIENEKLEQDKQMVQLRGELIHLLCEVNAAQEEQHSNRTIITEEVKKQRDILQSTAYLMEMHNDADKKEIPADLESSILLRLLESLDAEADSNFAFGRTASEKIASNVSNDGVMTRSRGLRSSIFPTTSRKDEGRDEKLEGGALNNGMTHLKTANEITHTDSSNSASDISHFISTSAQSISTPMHVSKELAIKQKNEEESLKNVWDQTHQGPESLSPEMDVREKDFTRQNKGHDPDTGIGGVSSRIRFLDVMQVPDEESKKSAMKKSSKTSSARLALDSIMMGLALPEPLTGKLSLTLNEKVPCDNGLNDSKGRISLNENVSRMGISIPAVPGLPKPPGGTGKETKKGTSSENVHREPCVAELYHEIRKKLLIKLAGHTALVRESNNNPVRKAGMHSDTMNELKEELMTRSVLHSTVLEQVELYRYEITEALKDISNFRPKVYAEVKCFAARLNNIFGKLVDERKVLKQFPHYQTVEARLDAILEADKLGDVFDSISDSISHTFKNCAGSKIPQLLRTIESAQVKFSEQIESLEQMLEPEKFRAFDIPFDICSRVACLKKHTLSLMERYISIVLHVCTELQEKCKDDPRAPQSMFFLLGKALNFSMKTHAFVGGLDAPTREKFAELQRAIQNARIDDIDKDTAENLKRGIIA